MITVDKTQRQATDHAEIWRGESNEPIRVVVDITIGDDLDDIYFSWTEGKTETSLRVPLERLKAILYEV